MAIFSHKAALGTPKIAEADRANQGGSRSGAAGDLSMRSMLVAMSLTASLLTSTPSGFQDRLWTFFSSLIDGTPAAHPLPTKAGCEMDPNGRCQPQTKAGCEMDPSGRCLSVSQPTLTAGCEMDPDGRCRTGS